MSARLFRGFALACAGLAAAAAAAAFWTLALQTEAGFQALLARISAWYSADGVVTPEGEALLRQTLALARTASLLAACWAATASWLLFRLSAAPGAAAPEEARRTVPTASADARRWRWWALGLILAAAVIRVPRLSTSLMYDEIFTVQHFATLPSWQVFFRQIESNNHALNSLLLHGVLSWSSNEALLRLPTYAAAVASLWLFFLVGGRLGGPAAGLLAAGVAAASPFHLWYSSLARGYMLGLCASLAGIAFLLHDPDGRGRRSLWGFGISQVLASLAMPTLLLLPAMLATCLLGAALAPWRRFIGCDPRSGGGARWLSASLWTLTAGALVNAPMAPFLLYRVGHSSHTLGGSPVEGAEWLALFSHGAAGAAIALSLIVAGAGWLCCRWTELGWPSRALMLTWASGSLAFFASPSPARVHLVAFEALVLMLALSGPMLARLAARLGAPQPVSAVLAAAVVLALTLGSSWRPLALAAEGYPFQDVRGAVRAAREALSGGGEIVTSGFTAREIGYYAGAEGVRVLTAAEHPERLVRGSEPFCYFRLYPEFGGEDPVFRFFQQTAPPTRTVEGREPIAMWCAADGAMMTLVQHVP
jgi:hypothetical protein